MALNFLKSNEDKTDFVLSGNSTSNAIPIFLLGTLFDFNKTIAKSLRVYIDRSLKLSRQATAVVHSSFYNLRGFAKVKPHLPAGTFEHVIHLFITYRLDYCNSLYIRLV